MKSKKRQSKEKSEIIKEKKEIRDKDFLQFEDDKLCESQLSLIPKEYGKQEKTMPLSSWSSLSHRAGQGGRGRGNTGRKNARGGNAKAKVLTTPRLIIQLDLKLTLQPTHPEND